jgi:hypothetical protein
MCHPGWKWNDRHRVFVHLHRVHGPV